MRRVFKFSILSVLVVVSVVVLGVVFYNNKKEIFINYVFSQKAYSYLSPKAKEYIKQVYEKTGEIILTEKNKKANKVYFNPIYIQYLNSSDEEKNKFGDIPTPMILDYLPSTSVEAVDIPSKYDLRDVNNKNFVTPARDQGNLGICWAFATAGALESHLLKTNETSYTSSSKLISERQIDYATSRNGIKDYKSEYVSFVDRSLGDGGNFYISTVALANGISSVDYNSFKSYSDRDLSKMELMEVLNYNKSLYEVNSTINFPRLSLRESTSILTDKEIATRNSFLNEVKQNIIDNGAAYLGTFMDSSCQYVDANLNNTVIDVYHCDYQGGHAMEIIGWDDNLQFSYCSDTKSHNSDTSNCNNIVSGKGVWILKNSWGNTLQYPYLTYDSLYSSISFIDEVESSNDKNWDNNYILGDGENDVKLKKYTLSDSKIKNEERLKKVKLITLNSDIEYSVEIKQKGGNNKTFSKTGKLPGLITIDITEDVLIDKDTEITIYSSGEFIDRVSIFTTNEESDPVLDLSKYDNLTVSEATIRLYSETKNIPSDSNIIYKLYNSKNQDVTSDATFANNKVAENNINTLVSFPSDLDSGKYRIDVLYNSNIIESININIVKMQGDGTKTNPYIITNSTQFNQIREDLDAYYELANDIDLTEDTHEGGKYSLASEVCPQGFGWEAINGFSGSLDGKGHTIRGLYQKNFITCNEEKLTTREWYNAGNGLFGNASGNVTIKNLVLEDFDITCQNGDCGILLSMYNANKWDNSDLIEYEAVFENIAVKNSKISAENYKNSTYGGGLFGYLISPFGNIRVSNIYEDFDLISDKLRNTAYLAREIQAKNIDINNIRLLGDLQGKYDDGSGDTTLVYSLISGGSISVKNILSTVTATRIGGNLGYSWDNIAIIDGINMINNGDIPICNRGCSNLGNVNVFNKQTQLAEFTKQSNYSSWQGFADNWNFESVDGIPRMPVLKFMDFEYTSISDITLNQVLNEKESIYDYLYPKIKAAKKITYKSNNENIIKLSDDGIFYPQASGSTTIHVESLYDGYIKDVPIQVTYVPHYTINFDGNSGIGEMESIEVNTESDYVLPANKFEKEFYVFTGWNTESDGTGISYTDLGKVNAMNDKETITLYAQWIGEQRIVTFDANGGQVNPESKIVNYGGTYGELPIPTRLGYGFTGWSVKGNAVDSTSNLYGYTLIAGWRENCYTIIYNANGGNVKSDYNNTNYLDFMSDSLATTYGFNNSTKKLSDDLYERTGYIFKGWNTKEDGTGTTYLANETISVSTVESSILKLYAQWSPVSYSIEYIINDEIIKTQIITYDSDTTVISSPMEKVGYNFSGWNTKTDGSGTIYHQNSIVRNLSNINGNIIKLYAIYTPITYIITFNSHGGGGIMNSQQAIYDSSITLSGNTFTRAGYVFAGWNTAPDGSGTSYSNKALVKNLSSENNAIITLYAIWEEEAEPYTIEKYDYDELKDYISNVDANTTVESFMSNIKLANGYTLSVDYKTIDGKNILYTGGKTRIYKNSIPYVEMTNIVSGDTNGDGKINYLDYVNVYNHIQKVKHPETSKKLLTDEYLLAADMSKDNKVSYLDYVLIYNKIKELKGGSN